MAKQRTERRLEDSNGVTHLHRRFIYGIGYQFVGRESKPTGHAHF